MFRYNYNYLEIFFCSCDKFFHTFKCVNHVRYQVLSKSFATEQLKTKSVDTKTLWFILCLQL